MTGLAAVVIAPFLALAFLSRFPLRTSDIVCAVLALGAGAYVLGDTALALLAVTLFGIGSGALVVSTARDVRRTPDRTARLGTIGSWLVGLGWLAVLLRRPDCRTVTGMTPRTAYSLAWLVLALATLVLLVHTDTSAATVAATFTAWCGGLVTARLARVWRARSVV